MKTTERKQDSQIDYGHLCLREANLSFKCEIKCKDWLSQNQNCPPNRAPNLHIPVDCCLSEPALSK
jgi:hypothetical protein